jgi:hypothetical protein
VLAVPPAGACTDDFDCASLRCVAGVCTIPCDPGSAGACDAAFGAGAAYCHEADDADVCLPHCDADGTTRPWGHDECRRALGALASCDLDSQQCLR